MNRRRCLARIAIASFLMLGGAGATALPGEEPSRPSPSPSPPKPSPVSVEVLGTVDAVNDPAGLLDESVVVGSDISVLYEIRPDASPDPASQPNMADYLGAIRPGDIQLKVGRYSFREHPERVQVTMVDGGTNAEGLFDGWYVYAPNPGTRLLGARHDLTIFLSLFDGTAQALGSTALVPVPSLEAWSEARIGVSRTVTTASATREEQFIAGKITSIRVVH